MWFATGAYGKEIWPGPHYFSDIDKIGRKLTHTLDELLLMDVSDSIKNKLSKAEPGSSVLIHNLHANGDLYVKRLRDEQLETVEILKKVKDDLTAAIDKVNKIEAEKKKLVSSLLYKQK